MSESLVSLGFGTTSLKGPGATGSPRCVCFEPRNSNWTRSVVSVHFLSARMSGCQEPGQSLAKQAVQAKAEPSQAA